MRGWNPINQFNTTLNWICIFVEHLISLNVLQNIQTVDKTFQIHQNMHFRQCISLKKVLSRVHNENFADDFYQKISVKIEKVSTCSYMYS